MTFNYAWHRARTKIEELEALPEDYVSVKEAADALGKAQTTIRTWIYKGHLTAVKFEGKTYINASELNHIS